QGRRRCAQTRIDRAEILTRSVATHDREPPDCAFIEPIPRIPKRSLRADRYGDVESCPDLQTREFGAGYSHDFDRLLVQNDLAPQNRNVARKLVLPECMAQDRSRNSTSPAVFLRREDAASLRNHSEHAKEVSAYKEAANRPPVRAETERVGRPSKHT